MIRKRLLSACLALALCLSLLPVTALADAPNGQVIYVGNENVTSGGYWTTDSAGNVTQYNEEGKPSNNYIHYNTATNTLTLHNATIKESVSTDTSTYVAGAAIGVHNQNGVAELTITLEGTNTIEDVSAAIHVFASSTSTGAANLTITGNGSLNASGSYNPGIRVQSNTGNGTLAITGAKVTASSSSGGNGVQIRVGNGSNASLTVNGGSLTATGSGGSRGGIEFQFGSSESGPGTPSLNVSGSAIVKASGDTEGITSNSSPVTPSGTGIVFNNGTGTVYGVVTLKEDLTIGEGESLTIPDEASLMINSGVTLTVDGGELTGENIPTEGVVYKVTGVTLSETTLTLEVGGEETLTATIMPDNATDQNVTWSSHTSGIVTIVPSTDTKTATITATGTGTTTITATVDGKSAECSVTVNAAAIVPVESVSLNKTSLELTEGETAQLNATMLPDNATNKKVTWSSNAPGVATVDSSGKVTAVTPGTATITVTTADGGKTATCVVTVTAATVPVTGVTLNKTSTSLYVGDTETLTATVQPSDASNQTVTWSTSDASVATVENGVVRATGRGTATITVTTVDGGFTATCTVTVSRYSTGGGPTTYAITAPDAENGTVRVSPSRASRGTTVTITVTPDEGYELESLTVLDSRDNEITLTDKGDGKYTFTMPSGRVTVEASFAEIAPEPLPFGDVDDGDWFADAVRFVYENGMMNGVSETDFAPHAATSRSMIVTILYRLEGEPVVDYAMGFTDVAGDAYYAEAVRWAASEGIVGGYGGGLFGSDDAVTREQLAVILYRYAVYKGYDVSIGEDTNILSYDDFADLSEYAIPAMQWACGAGVITGVTDATLVPQGEATRAQVAAMLMRFVEAIG